MLRYLSRSTSRVAEKPGPPSDGKFHVVGQESLGKPLIANEAQGTPAAATPAPAETSQETSITSESPSVPADLPSPSTLR